jgi:hypothetical protein
MQVNREIVGESSSTGALKIKNERRKKLLKLLPRKTLENEIDSNRRPWDWSRADLESYFIMNWDDTDIPDAIKRYVEISI